MHRKRQISIPGRSYEVNNPTAISEISFELQKKPHFYGTWWFLTLYLFAAAFDLGHLSVSDSSPAAAL
jgi:hypothetical protein